MKNAVEMGPDAIIYIPSFVKTGSGIQKDTQTTWSFYKPTFAFLRISRLKLRMKHVQYNRIKARHESER
jgi:hypothetical protein